MSPPGPQTTSIRPLNLQDEQLFLDFYQALSEETHAFFFPHDPSPTSLSLLLRNTPSNRDVVRFMTSVQEDGREIMAGYVFFWDWLKKIPWFGICVRDAYQGRGLGRQMMEFAINLARQKHKGGILLSTMKANHRAQSLYATCGFETIGESDDGQVLMILRFDEEEEL